MKTTYSRTSSGPAFTLLELLVTIAIIGLLASILIPTIGTARRNAKISMAKSDMASLQAGIAAYVTDYGRFPSSTAAYLSAAPDFTYGNDVIRNGTTYEADNRDVMAILTALTTFRDGSPTVNTNHHLNPRKSIYFNSKAARTEVGHGIGPGGVLRDPWGNPYIITLDLNFNRECYDALYRQPAVSQSTNGIGREGLAKDSSGEFYLQDTVMIWSLGPDGLADPNVAADVPPNADNVLGWD